MAKDKGRDRSENRRLMECKNCGQRFYSYRVTKQAECPQCNEMTAKVVSDQNIEDGNLPQAGRFSEGKGTGVLSGCIGPIIIFIVVLGIGYALYHFRDEIGKQFGTGNEPANATNEYNLPEVETIEDAPADEPLETDVPKEE